MAIFEVSVARISINKFKVSTQQGSSPAMPFSNIVFESGPISNFEGIFFRKNSKISGIDAPLMIFSTQTWSKLYFFLIIIKYVKRFY